MKLFVTYCSKEKCPDEVLLPALDRYRSSRIRALHRVAADWGAEFRILSGRYGLLAADDEIPDYDHLLTDVEISQLAADVATQLREIDPSQVVFVMRPETEDDRTGPYRDCIVEACRTTGHQLIEVRTNPRNEMPLSAVG